MSTPDPVAALAQRLYETGVKWEDGATWAELVRDWPEERAKWLAVAREAMRWCDEGRP